MTVLEDTIECKKRRRMSWKQDYQLAGNYEIIMIYPVQRVHDVI